MRLGELNENSMHHIVRSPRTLRRLVAAASLVTLNPGFVLGQHPQGAPAARAASPAETDDTRARRVDSLFARYDSAGSPGCAVAVIRAGRLAYSHGYGLSNVGTGTRITPGSVFGLASLSKQFTAFSILLLAHDGRVSLDDDVRKWLPELPGLGAAAGTRITIRQLVHHTSGIPDYVPSTLTGDRAITDPMTEQQFLEFLKQQKLEFSPGTRFHYSSSGYALLAMIVQRASGQSLREFAAEHVFKPLRMTSTQFNNHAPAIPNLASAYINRNTLLTGDQPPPDSTGGWYKANSRNDLLGATGLYSTVEDLAKWDGNFYDHAVGGPTVLAMMQERGVLASGDTIPYAAGLFIGAYRGLRTVAHIGGWSGYQSWLARYPDQRFSVAVLCNRRVGLSVPTPPWADRVAEIYLGDQMAPDIEHVVANALGQGGPDSAVRTYHTLRARYPAIAFEEQQLNHLGYQLLQGGKVDAAIAIFRLNADAFPKSANVYDSMGEAYMNHGDRTLAIKNYERSLALNPANDNASKMLAKLKSQAP